MPQLEITTYLTQYRWTLITLFLLLSSLVVYILPTIKSYFIIKESNMGDLVQTPLKSDLGAGAVLVWEKLDTLKG